MCNDNRNNNRACDYCRATELAAKQLVHSFQWLKLVTLFRQKPALHFGFLLVHKSPGNLHMAGHNGPRQI